MTQSAYHPWLHRFAMLTAAATLALVGIGGLVTSHEAGMAVPDWPTSYGYNPFLFPFDKWWHTGNIFYEHSHRLFASGVGFLTIILMVWLWRKDSLSREGIRTVIGASWQWLKNPRGWLQWSSSASVRAGVRTLWQKPKDSGSRLQWLGVTALFVVVLQGV